MSIYDKYKERVGDNSTKEERQIAWQEARRKAYHSNPQGAAKAVAREEAVNTEPNTPSTIAPGSSSRGFFNRMFMRSPEEQAQKEKRKKEEKQAYEQAYHQSRVAYMKKKAHKDAQTGGGGILGGLTGVVNASMKELGGIHGGGRRKGNNFGMITGLGPSYQPRKQGKQHKSGYVVVNGKAYPVAGRQKKNKKKSRHRESGGEPDLMRYAF
jgi:hypothetical protein